MSTLGKVYKRRGLEAAMAHALAGLWGTEPSLWAGRCYLCKGDLRAARYGGRSQREALTRLRQHLRREHGHSPAAIARAIARRLAELRP